MKRMILVVMSCAAPLFAQLDMCDSIWTLVVHDYQGGARGDYLRGVNTWCTDSIILGNDSIKVYHRLGVSTVGEKQDTLVLAMADVDSMTFCRNHGLELLDPPTNRTFHFGDTVWFQWAADLTELSGSQYGVWPQVGFARSQRIGSMSAFDLLGNDERILPRPNGTYPYDGDYREGSVGHFAWVIPDSIAHVGGQMHSTISDSVHIGVYDFYDDQGAIMPGGSCNPMSGTKINSAMQGYFRIVP